MKIETFFEKFELLTDAPNAVVKLRETILQLAVRGKLIAQDYNDEPVNLLVDRARDQLGKIIKDKGCRNSETLLPIREDEIPYDIPQNWKWVRIGEIALIRGGKRLPQGASFAIKSTPRIYIQVTNMKNGTILKEDLKYLDEEVYRVIKNYIIEKDDLYISIAGTIGQVGEVPEIFHQMNLTENAARIIFRELNKKYFRITLNSELVQNQFKQKTNQQAQPKLALKRIADAIIPLPPIAEQKRIVEKCDRLLSLCNQIEVRQQQRQESIVRMNESAIAQLLSSQNPNEFSQHWQRICNNFDLLYSIPETIPKLRQAILQLAVQGKLVPQDPNDEPASILLEKADREKGTLFSIVDIQEDEEPFSLPKYWKWTYFEKVLKRIHYGYTASANFNIQDVRLLRITDIQNNKVDWSIVPGCEIKKDELEKFVLNEGDLLIARTGGTIGKSYLVESLHTVAVFASYLIRAIPCSQAYPRYLKLFLDSSLYWEQLYAKSMGTGQPNVNATSLKSLAVPIPPLAEQKRIVAKVDRLISLCDTLEAKLKEARSHSEMLMEVAAKQVLVA